jgi:hypothetical protein
MKEFEQASSAGKSYFIAYTIGATKCHIPLHGDGVWLPLERSAHPQRMEQSEHPPIATSGTGNAKEDLPMLQSIFPGFDITVIQAVLDETDGDVQRATETLLALLECVESQEAHPYVCVVYMPCGRASPLCAGSACQ